MIRLFLLFTILFQVSCDTPMRTRDPFGKPLSDTTLSQSEEDVDSFLSDENLDDVNSSDTLNSAGFDTCPSDYQYYAGDQIGYLLLCQSSQEEVSFKMKLKSTDLDIGTCFVPVHIRRDGNSFKLGIAECVHNEAGKLYDMRLTKERSESINGVMVIKANALNPYMQCMSAKVDYMNAYPGCQYNSSCMQAAQNYAYQVCSSFVSHYRNYYKQIRL